MEPSQFKGVCVCAVSFQVWPTYESQKSSIHLRSTLTACASYFLLCQGLYLAFSPGIVLYMVWAAGPRDFEDVARAVSGLTEREKIIEQVIVSILPRAAINPCARCEFDQLLNSPMGSQVTAFLSYTNFERLKDFQVYGRSRPLPEGLTVMAVPFVWASVCVGVFVDAVVLAMSKSFAGETAPKHEDGSSECPEEVATLQDGFNFKFTLTSRTVPHYPTTG